MAELTRYQQTGRIFADVPQLDFANVRESFKRSQTISNALDRVSEFAFKEAAKNAERQAEQFAIDNPLTIDQVREASRSGVKPEDLIKSTGGGQIWQETLTKLQGEQLRSQLEVLGKQALVDLQTQVETGQITNMEDVRLKQEAVVNGLRKTLSFSPDSVMRFDATMGTISSALYKEAQGQLVRDYKLSQQSQAKVNYDNSLRAYKAMLNTGVESPEMLREIEYALADQLERQSADGGMDFALKLKDDFYKEMQAVKLSSLINTAVSPEFAKDMTSSLTKIRNGDLGKFTPIYNTLSEDDKKKVRQDVASSWSDLYNARESDRKNLIRENEEINKADIKKMLSLPDNSKQKKELAKSLFDRNAITIDTLKSIIEPKAEGDGDIMSEAYADRDIALGRITNESRLRSLYPTLNNKQVKKLLMSMTDKATSNARAKIRTAAGAAASDLVPIDIPTAKRIQDITAIYESKLEEVSSNGTYKYDPNEALEIALKEYPKSEKYNTAKTKQSSSLNSIKNNFKGFNPDTMDVEDYAKKAKIDEVMKVKLQRYVKTYKEQKAITGLTSEALQ